MSLSNLAQNQYQITATQTASPEKLLLMLYDGAIKFSKAAIKELNDHQYENANTYLIKVEEIIEELIISLNMDYEISNYLQKLYRYFIDTLVEANLRKDSAMVEQVLGFLTELRETWVQAAQNINKMPR